MNKISIFQFFLGLFIVHLGFVYISLPSILVTAAKRDVTIIFIVVIIIYGCVIAFYNRFHRYFVVHSFFKWLYVFYWSMNVLVLVVSLTSALKRWLLFNTPAVVIIVLILIVCFYGAVSRAETTINIPVFIIPLIIIFLITLLRVLPELRVYEFFPLFNSTKGEWLHGFLFAWYAFMGAELFLIFRKYVIQNVTAKSIAIFVSIIGGMHLFAIVITLLYFPRVETQEILEPLLYILNAQEVMFLKRLDIFFIYIWFAWSVVAMLYYLLAIKIVTKMDEMKRKNIILAVLLSVIAVMSINLVNIDVILMIKDYLVYFVVVFSFLLPISIIIFNRMRRKKCDTDSFS